jgi:hypothetical protein
MGCIRKELTKVTSRASDAFIFTNRGLITTTLAIQTLD